MHRTRRDELRNQLFQQFGPLIPSRDLHVVLGLPSASAVRQARCRGHLGVRTIKIPHRRGHFAYTAEVVDWLTDHAKEAAMT